MPKVTVTLLDPEEHLTADLDMRDVVAFQTVGRKMLNIPYSISDEAYRQAAPMPWMAYQAWNACVRAGSYSGDYDSFLARCVEIADPGGPPDTGDGLDPTSRAAPPG